jgi:ABC-type transport system substrate-binding protein
MRPSGRNRRSSHCSLPEIHRSTHVTYRRARCASTRSAPARSSLSDIKTQAPQATCEIGMASESVGMLVNRTAAPFDNAELRRAMALTLDRKSFIDILGQAEGELGGALLPPPDGVWGMPPERLRTLPGLRR